MLARLLADLVVVVHFAFIAFIVVGSLGWLWRRWWPWLHLPVAIYGIAIEWIGWTCPLTPLENNLRWIAGEQGYQGGFVEHHLLPIIYPGPMTAAIEYLLGALVLIVNVLLYGWIWRRRRRSN